MRKKNHIFIKFLIISIILILLFMVSLLFGRYNDVFSTNFSDLFGDDSAINTILFSIRLPRILAAILIGGSLSVSGAAFQGIFKNPLVSPDLLGASSGACFGAALGILLSFSYFLTTSISFIFGIISVILVYILFKFSKTNKILSIVLAGIMISSLFSAMTSFIKLVADTESKLPSITYWLMGNLSSIKIEDIYYLAPVIIISMIPILLLSWRINLLTLSDIEAKSLGVNVNLLSLVVIVCSTIMTSISVSVSGMIGWVGLVIPHLSRKIFGHDFRLIFPASFLLGGIFLLICDDISRCLLFTEIPIGILTAFVGAPSFFYMLFKRRKI